nr:Chain P, histone 2a peptide [synthetic construct]2D31_C Chain C, 9-mer peptide from Histone H2A [Homo sapiens]2D31_F Chain F, 9-mer peptide from Histone H2A [Homo sapiens]2DYP_C Chain C, Mer Peptide From Histone H2A.x [synthetic construct]6AEE_C Chain C, Mer Peptide (RL9) From Histone H2A.x [Homo sapiens]6AEE_F Chain F, Mer Peptide (RL9) From Histone H2A.x [Homo sapiens]6K60_C Chain C, Peptide from Histone H2A.J [Homo sapiens]6K60_G Chain G, Peptide from Histone H2A.J [Homo sapiens]
RIIPRHLQL